jgi:hypothetical protein
MSRLKGPKLGAMPLSFSAAKVNPLSNHGVTELMVEDGRDPSTGGWLEELSRDDYLASSNVTRGEHSLLRAAAPGNDVRVEFRPIGIVLSS